MRNAIYWALVEIASGVCFCFVGFACQNIALVQRERTCREESRNGARPAEAGRRNCQYFAFCGVNPQVDGLVKVSRYSRYYDYSWFANLVVFEEVIEIYKIFFVKISNLLI